MKKLSKNLLFLFNIYSLLNLRIDGSKVKNSKFWTMINFLSIPCSVFLSSVTPSSIFENAFKTDVTSTNRLSAVFINSYNAMRLVYALVIFFCIYVQWWKRFTMEKIVNIYLQFYQNDYFCFSSIIEEAKHQCEEKYLKLLILGVAQYCIEFFSTMNLSWQGIVAFIFFRSKGYTYVVFLFLLNCFLSYFICLIKNINYELEKVKISMYKRSQVTELTNNITCLHSLLCEFQNSFGFLLSFGMFITIATIVIRVNT